VAERLLVRLRGVAGDEVGGACWLKHTVIKGGRIVAGLHIHCCGIALHLTHVSLVCVVKRLSLCAAARHRLKFLDLQDAASVSRLDVLAVTLAVLLEFLIHVEEQLLNRVARYHVLLVEARADAQMKWLFRLLLLGSLLEARTLAT
jgi:hypothetical protein